MICLVTLSHAYPLAYIGHGHAISTQNVVRHDGPSHGYVAPEHGHFHHHGFGLGHGYVHGQYYDEYVSISRIFKMF